jgi:cytochrome c peroxidase
MMPGKFALALASALAVGVPSIKGDWSTDELQILRSLTIESLGPPPPDPTNRVADSKPAAELGRALFFDTQLSSNGRVSCASCHRPAHGFTDSVATGRGVGSGTRRTMPIAQAVYSPWQFWDGRADSLWAQALGPVENPLEHNLTRTQVAHLLATKYRRPYEALFGPLPDLSDRHRFPRRASPNGDRKARAAWLRMSPGDKLAIDRIFASFGKTIAAFERTLPTRPTRFDIHVAGLTGAGPDSPFTPSETAGLKLFIGKANCVSCHNGPMLSNGGFANTGVPARAGLPYDAGRIMGARMALADAFNCKGAFSDAGGAGCEELEFMVRDVPDQVRAYKVPSLRNVAMRAPFMHAGQFKTLDAVLTHYDRAPSAPAGTSELRPLSLTKTERANLVSFLHTLTEESSGVDR